MGAGDVKYLTTYFLLLPFPYHGSALKYLLITTVIFASIMVAFKILSNFRMAVSSYFHQNGKFFYQMVRGKTVYAPIILLSHLWICLKH